MKALILRALKQIEMVEVETPTIKDNEVLIRTGASTICTSDIIDARENPFGIHLPVIIGHEAAGTIAELGKEVNGYRIGDRVATHPVHPCKKCSACLSGLGHLCRNMGHFGINLPGTFAEYYVARQDRVRQIPDAVDFTTASLTEPVCVCLEALAQANLSPGNSLLIIGDGPFGLMMSRLAAKYSLGKVVVAGLIDFRLSYARQALPINLSHLLDQDEVLIQASGGDGYDAAILAVNGKNAFTTGLHCLKPKGRLVVFAATKSDTPVNLFHVHINELEIKGACNDQNRLDDAIVLLDDPVLSLSDFVTHRFSLTEFREAFLMADKGKAEALKVAFVF